MIKHNFDQLKFDQVIVSNVDIVIIIKLATNIFVEMIQKIIQTVGSNSNNFCYLPNLIQKLEIELNEIQSLEGEKIKVK